MWCLMRAGLFVLMVGCASAADSVDWEAMITHSPENAAADLTELLQSSDAMTESQKAEYHLLLSHAYYNQYIAQDALDNAIVAADLLAQSDKPALYQGARLAEASALDLLARSEEALPMAESVLEWAEKHDDIVLEIEALKTIGFSALSLAEHTKALQAMQRAYLTLKRQPDTAPISHRQFASYLAQVHEYRGEPEESLPLYLEAANYNREHGLALEHSYALFGAGRAYLSLKEPGNAIEALEESLAISIEQSDEQGAAYTQIELLNLRIDNKQLATTAYPTALETVRLCRQSFEDAGNQYQVALAWGLEAELLVGAGHLAKALLAIDKALDIADSPSQAQEKLKFLHIKAGIERTLGNIESAYHYLEQAYNLREQLNRKTEKAMFQRLRAEFRLEQQETENKLLNEANSRQRAEIDVAEKQQTIIALASTDALTGLDNRRVILAFLEQQIQQGGNVHVALLDLDNFKLVNDNYGHQADDDVLKMTAKEAQRCLPLGSRAGRIGGEEFLITFTALSAKDCQSWLQDYAMRVNLSENIPPSVNGEAVTFSIGLTAANPGESVPDVMGRADNLMYKAKTAGKNRIFNDPSDLPDQN